MSSLISSNILAIHGEINIKVNDANTMIVDNFIIVTRLFTQQKLAKIKFNFDSVSIVAHILLKHVFWYRGCALVLARAKDENMELFLHVIIELYMLAASRCWNLISVIKLTLISIAVA